LVENSIFAVCTSETDLQQASIMKTTLPLLALMLGLSQILCGQALIFQNNKYKVFGNGVEQKPYKATVISDTEIHSDYRSPANEFVNPGIEFKFSINGKDNELPVGTNHFINCSSARCETPLIIFGERSVDKAPLAAGMFLKPDTEFLVRLDLRHVFTAFQEKGYYQTYSGTRIYKDDFKGVYVAGNTTPLTWDFDNLHNFKNLQLQDPDGDHIFEVTLVLNSQKDKQVTNSSWKLVNDITAFPKYAGPYPLLNAIYNLSLDEMVRAVEKDSTLRTGKEWAGVWTRDVSYSIILSMAVLQPKVAQYSLLRKVNNGVVIQDTGTGGAYPVSTDRMIWAVAAWEIYKVTGERKWLETIYPIIKKSLDDDSKNAFDPVTGLVKGESSFLDWREQTYPAWMEPADIFESECLGTNAVHYQAHTLLALMAGEMKDDVTANTHREIAAKIKNGINNSLWLNDKGYYGQFLYGRIYKTVSPRAEALGEALTVLFDIADQERQKKVVASSPVNQFGIPCIYPQIPNIPPYHNNGVWPFVQSYWSMACAKAGNETALVQSLAAIYRPTSLFLTNKENFVAENGDFVGTQINSDNMLWSLSGNISMIYKVLFGMEYTTDGLAFRPFVPKVLGGKHVMRSYPFRNAVLDLEVNGFGNKVESIMLDGQPLNGNLPYTITGKHTIVMTLSNVAATGLVNNAAFLIAPESPVVTLDGQTLSWRAVPRAAQYLVLRNGKTMKVVTATQFQLPSSDVAEYQVISIDKTGTLSFASEPIIPASHPSIITLQAESVVTKSDKPYKGFAGGGFVMINTTQNTQLDFTVSVPSDGNYAIDFRYANGNGPVNTENKCGLRSLIVNDEFIEAVVFPQRGTGEWSEWGYSNSVVLKLKGGVNKISLRYEPFNENMNGAVNEAAIDLLRVVNLR
jgi:hypothetical protein